jgi:nucleoporin POM152
MSPRVTNAPLIPLDIIDAPSQRLYVFAIYVALLGWRLYDWGKLVEDEVDSLWLFIKWVATDAVVFLYALPALRIPWLEWSNPAIMSVFLVHAVLNGMLMFRIPVRYYFPKHIGYTNIEATDPS